MKRIGLSVLMLAAFLGSLLALSGCSSSVYTTYNRGHVYAQGETVELFTAEGDEKLGSFVIQEVYILRDTPFTLREFDDYDEDGDAIYKDVRYEAVVQVNYTWQREPGANLSIDNSNFAVYDAEGNLGQRSPDIAYSKMPADDHCFVAAIEELGDYVEIRYIHGAFQEYAAKVQVYFDGSMEPQVTMPVSNLSSEPQAVASASDRTCTVLWVVCIMEFVALGVMTALFIWALLRKKKET